MKPLFAYDFTKPVILDTNALLNATFNSGGMAAHSLWSLRKMATAIYVTPSIEAEVGRVSDRLKLKYGLAYDPAEVVRISLGAHGILFAPIPLGPPLAGINRPDEPIARAAKQLDAVIITDDIEFIIEARSAGVDAWQYWEVSRSYTGEGELPSLSKIVRFGAPASVGGYVFARVDPGGWAGLKIDHQFSVCEIDEGVWVYYDGTSEHWNVRTPAGEVVRLPMPLKQGIHYVVGVNIRPVVGGDEITLMAAEVGGQIYRTKSVVGSVGVVSANSRLNVGHSRRQRDHWNGLIKDLVVASGSLPARTFRLLASTEDLSPNPSDSDKLSEAVQRVVMLAS